jgi:HK97 family phage portal protein
VANIWNSTLETLGIREKLNPSQPFIKQDAGTNIATSVKSYWAYFENLGIVNRAVNMIVDDASQIDIVVDNETIPQDFRLAKGVKRQRVVKLLNHEPNPFMDIGTFRRLVFTDLLVEGNAFIYFDGVHIYHLPAHMVEILPDNNTYLAGYKVRTVLYDADEIIHIKDNALRNVYRGSSRLKGAQKNMDLLWRMINFQDTFFENGAVPSLVLKSPNALSDKLKERMIEGWLRAYSPNKGGRRPLILDGGLELDTVSNISFKELDFENSTINQEKAILTTLGIPPILLAGGNNANIRPNQRLFYVETVVPFVDKTLKAFERYFGFKLMPDNDVPGMQPELREQATFYSTLVNAGIITINEARRALTYDDIDGQDELRVPQNIAGSAVNPSEGGRPEENDDE